MPNIIDSIQISSSTFDVRDKSATTVVNLTQDEYDNLPSSAKTANVLYNITDASPIDISQYWTSAQTQSAITEATSGKADTSYVDQSVSGKVDASTFEAYSGNVETALSGKQDALIAGENITISGNVISAEGGSITIDPSLDSGSTNPVANSAITTALNDTVKLSNLSTNYINGFTNYVNRTIPIFHRFNINNQSNGNAWWFGKINNKYVITTGQTSVTPSDLMNLQVIETSAITTSVTSSSTDAQVPSAKAVYDAIQEGGGIDSGTVQTMIDESITGKTNQSDFTAHTANTTVHVTSAEKTTWNAKSDFSGDYNDLTNKLSAGTNVSIVDNVISAEGGGKAVSGGTNISVTTGETADTINCTLPITATSNAFNTISVGQGSGGGSYNTLIGPNARCDNNNGHNVFLVAQHNGNSASGAYVNGTNNVIIGSIKDGYLSFNMPSFTTSNSVVIGGGGISTDKNNSVAIGYSANVSGTTKTNINNQLTIDTSNQVYIYNKDNTEMICLQDQLGGGGGITSGDVQSMIDESISGKTDESAFTAHTADTTIHVTSSDKTTWSGKQDALVSGTNIKTINNESILGSGNITIQGGGGSSVVELTQAQYDALTTIDPDTIYVITDAAGGDLSNYYTKAQINAMIGDIESLLAAI